MSTQGDGTWQPPTAEERDDENDREHEETPGAPDAAGSASTGTDPEALGHEREQYPDPESYPSPREGEQQILDGSTPDADLQVDGERT